jgi:hypothetical protein
MGQAKRRMDATGFQMNPLKPGEQIVVDVKNAKQRECECGCKYFIPVVAVYTVSALMSPTGQELTAQRPVMVCMECKKALE